MSSQQEANSPSNQKVNEPKAQKVAGKTSGLKSFLSGGFGGACLVAAGHPFDLVKVRLQTSNQYKGFIDCATKIVTRDGFRGLYRGMSAPLIGVTPIFAVCFWGYDMGKKIAVAATKHDPSKPLTYGQIMFAGGFSAIPTTLIMAPGERIKVLLQIQGQQEKGEKPKFKGPVDVVKHLYKEGGIRSIFKGSAATLLRDVPGSVAYFGAYEYFKHTLTPPNSTPDKLNTFSILVAGGMAGVCNWLVAIPPDVLKSRLQSAPEGTYPNGIRDVFVQLIRSEGVPGLFKGVVPAMARAFPANAACFLGMEASLKFMNYLW